METSPAEWCDWFSSVVVVTNMVSRILVSQDNSNMKLKVFSLRQFTQLTITVVNAIPYILRLSYTGHNGMYLPTSIFWT